MKKGQTSKRGGYEDILFPMEICNITQGDNTGTHKGTYATDLAGKDTGRDLFYAPFSVVCKAVDAANGNAVWWESQNKVRFADGTIDYATIMIVHDNSLGGIYVGAKYKQGIQIAQEGTAGKATGNHLHFEIAKGKYDHMYDLNKYGVYHLPNNMPIENACFMDNTTIKQGIAKWKYLKDVKVSESKCPYKSSGTVEALYDKIRVRTSPSTKKGDTGLVYNKGMILNYRKIVKADGWYWAEYERSNGGIGYCALCKENGSSKYWKQV